MSAAIQLERVQDIVRQIVPDAVCLLQDDDITVRCCALRDNTIAVHFDLHGIAFDGIVLNAKRLAALLSASKEKLRLALKDAAST